MDSTSINSFATSYHKLRKVSKLNLTEKIHIPSLSRCMFIASKINVKPLLQYLQNSQQLLATPIFTFQVWGKIKKEVKLALKKLFHERFKSINEGNIIVLNSGQSLNVRSDYFCLSPHLTYTTLIPIARYDMSSASIAVSEPGLKWQAESEQTLLQKLQTQQLAWDYALLEQGDLIIVGRDCIYGSFRNDGPSASHYIEMRWIKSQSSSSSSNSSS